MAAGLVGAPGGIGICDGGESAIFCLRARDDGFGNPCVPHSSIRLLVHFVTVSTAGLAVNALMVTACDRLVTKSKYYPSPNSHREDYVELGVGIFARNVVAIKTIKELLAGVSLRRTDGGGW